VSYCFCDLPSRPGLANYLRGPHSQEFLVATLNFSAEEHGRAIRVRVTGGRSFIIGPGEFRDCISRAERQLAAGERDMVLEVAGKMRLRLTGCRRSELQTAVRIMQDVLDECSEAATAFAALN
jgi:hypothetical protein